jgi:uncharacterized iron-regulated membrane protein
MSWSARGAWVWLHRWVGLLAALVLVIEGLTGSLLAFRAPITRWLAPGQHASAPFPGAKPLSMGEIGDRAEAILGAGGRVGYFFDGSAEGVVMVRVGPATDTATGATREPGFGWLALDPWTGRELGRYPYERYSAGFVANIMPVVYQLHVALMLGGVGTWILGIVAVAWTLDCLYAVYLTFPRGRHRFLSRWREAWRIKRGARGLRLHFDLHRAGGLWPWLLLFALAWSSVQLVMLLQVYEPVMAHISDYQPVLEAYADLATHVPERQKLGWQQAQARGEELIRERARIEGFTPGRATTLAYFSGVYSYSVMTDRRWPQFPEYNLYLDADSGALNRINRETGEHAGNTFSNWLRALHMASGPLDNAWYRWLLLFTGLHLCLLSYTGVVIWWRKRAARSWSRVGASRGS